MLSLIAAVVVAAQPSAPAAAPLDPARVKAATELVELLNVRGQIERNLMQNVGMMKTGVALRQMLAQQPGFVQAYEANRGKFDPALQKAGAIQAEVAQKVITANLGAVVNAAVKSYARTYTLAELQGLAAFYRTPTGKALYQKQGRVSADISQATSQIIGGKIDAGMKANGKRLEAALAPLNQAATPKK